MDGRCCKSGFGRVLCSRSSWFPHLLSAERGILKLSHRARWPFRGRRVMAYFNPVWKAKADLLYFYISFNEIYLQILFYFPLPPLFPPFLRQCGIAALFTLEKYYFCLLCYFVTAGFDKTMDWFYLVRKLFPFICSPGNLLGSWKCVWSQFQIELSHFYLMRVSVDA